jgi:hypothetical protein
MMLRSPSNSLKLNLFSALATCRRLNHEGAGKGQDSHHCTGA